MSTEQESYLDLRLAVNQPITNGEQPFTVGEDRNQSVKGSSPFGGATPVAHLYCFYAIAAC